MDNKLMDCFTNPIMCKLFLEILSSGTVTAKQLAEVHQDIAQTTLYRYLKRMTDDGIIKVIKENPVRGTVEKTYTLAVDFNTSIENIIDNNSGEAYMMLFMQYISGFIRSFQDYCKRKDINIKEDISTFTTAPIYATNNELESAMKQIGEIVMGLVENKPANNRKLRNLGFIITPPQGIER